MQEASNTNVESVIKMYVRIICGFTIAVLMSWRPNMPTLVATKGIFLLNVCMNCF